MGWTASDREAYDLLREAKAVRELIEKNNLQPLMDHIFENKREFADYLLSFYKADRPEGNFNRNQAFYQQLINMDTAEEVPYVMQVAFWSHESKGMLVKFEDLPMQLASESMVTRSFAEYRLQHGI
jgi:hypothetical protein